MRVLSDLLLAVDGAGDVDALVLFGLSAAFDAVGLAINTVAPADVIL